MSDTNPDQDEFYMLIGHCITAWANLDDKLFEIFWKVLSCSRKHAAIVYYRTPGLDQRLNLTDELTRSILPATEGGKQQHPHLKLWATIKNTITNELSIRRRIAHHPVRTDKVKILLENNNGAFKEDPSLEFSYYELYVSEAEALRGKHTKPDTLTRTELLNHQQMIERLALNLQAFYIDILSKHLSK